jgi:leader peptidase (prepilin peptidase) / N-methyltransferase
MAMELIFDAVPMVLIFCLGAAIGSFLNVVVYRLPAGLSLIHPPSRCPHCGHRLGPTENVPIVGWIRLKGRCKSCRSPISMRYPMVETIGGLMFVLVFVVCGFSAMTIGYWLLFSWLLALALIDLDTMTLPNELTQSGLVMGLLFQVGLGAIAADPGPAIAAHLLQGLLGMAVGIWVLAPVALLVSVWLQKNALGGGDPKLLAMVGAWLGPQLVLLSIPIAAIVGLLASCGAMAVGQMRRGQAFPFGPFLAIAAAIVALAGEPMLAAYVRWAFPT